MGCPKAELSLTLTDDATIQELNKTWRGKDKPTDVLSFSQVEEVETRGVRVTNTAHLRVLGDVVISVETAARQAPRYGNDLEGELTRLLVHGVLHLLGHDHVHGGHQARIMKEEEARLLRAIRRGGG